MIPNIGHTAVILKKLLASHSGCEVTRCQMITSLILGHWQGKAPWAEGYAPSFILVNGGNSPDPCMHLPRVAFNGDLPDQPPPNFPGSTKEGAEALMINIVRKEAQRSKVRLNTRTERDHESALKDHWLKCQKMRYGSERTARYGQHNAELGLASNDEARTSLFVETEREVSTLEADLLNPSSAFWNHWGHGRDYKEHSYQAAIVGSIPPELWTASLVDAVIDSGAPILFLPHVAGATEDILTESEAKALFTVVADPGFWATAGVVVPPTYSLPEIHPALHMLIREYLQELPEAYSYYVQTMMHHISARVEALVFRLILKEDQSTQYEWGQKLRTLTFEAAIRGILFGLASLAYHSRAVPFSCNHLQVARSFLSHLRGQNSCTVSNFSTAFNSVDKETCDEVLTSLVAEKLIVKVDGILRAATFTEFTQSLNKGLFVPPPRSWDDIQVPKIGGKATSSSENK